LIVEGVNIDTHFMCRTIDKYQHQCLAFNVVIEDRSLHMRRC